MNAFIVTVVTKAAPDSGMQAHSYLTIANNGAEARLHALTEHRVDAGRAADKVITTSVQPPGAPSVIHLNNKAITEDELKALGGDETLYRTE